MSLHAGRYSWGRGDTRTPWKLGVYSMNSNLANSLLGVMTVWQTKRDELGRRGSCRWHCSGWLRCIPMRHHCCWCRCIWLVLLLCLRVLLLRCRRCWCRCRCMLLLCIEKRSQHVLLLPLLKLHLSHHGPKSLDLIRSPICIHGHRHVLGGSESRGKW